MRDSIVTIFKHFADTGNPHYITLEDALKRISSGKSMDKVDRIRDTDDDEIKSELKMSLPCVLFSGRFSKRVASGLIEHSGLIILDFDNQDPIQYKEKLAQAPYIVAAWTSPSGNGVKALVRISDSGRHRDHFEALKVHHPEIDRSGADVSRICYESYDPEIYINFEAEEYVYVVDPPQVERRAPQIEETNEDVIYGKLRKWIESRGEMFIEGNRNHFIMKMAAAMNRTGVSESAATAFLVHDFCNDGFSVKEATSVVSKVYRNYKDQHGIARFEADSIVSSNGVMNEAAFSAEMDVEDLIYFSDVYENLKEMRSRGVLYGETTHFQELDRRFRWARRELTVVHGYGNHGKSAFMLQLQLIKSVKEGKKWAIFSPENFPTEHFYKDILQAKVGKSIDKEFGMTDYEMETAYEFINNHFFYIYPEKESPTPELILKRFMETKLKHGIDGVMIDPFNQLTHKWGARDDHYLEEILSKFKRFAQSMDVFFTIIAHPGKPLKNKSGGYDRPTVFDLAGGAMWNNKADNILCYHRPNFYTNPEDRLCEIEIQKIKKQPWNGLPGLVEMEYRRKEFRFFMNGWSPLGLARPDERFTMSPNLGAD